MIKERVCTFKMKFNAQNKQTNNVAQTLIRYISRPKNKKLSMFPKHSPFKDYASINSYYDF